MPVNRPKRRRAFSISTPQDLTKDPALRASPSQQNLEGSFGVSTESRLGTSVLPEPMIGQHNAEGKMLLPALPRRLATMSRTSEKNRTTHACDLCRKAKAKCTGEQPCQKCKNEGKECVYGDGKRDKERKILERTSRQNENLRAHAEALRNSLRMVFERSNLTDQEQKEISELLDKPLPNFTDEDEEDGTVGPQYRSLYPQTHFGEDEEECDEDAGSTRSLDTIAIDPNRDEESRATGFLGKSSSARWIQRAEREVHDVSSADANKTDSALYHTGDPDLCGPVSQGGHAGIPWKYELPALDVASNLIDSYFKHVHPDFPILSKDAFMRTFHRFSENRGSIPSENDHIALCQINCVFAISSTFAQLVASQGEDDHRNHLVYYARTRALGLEQQPANALTSIDYVCSLGLLGLYLISNYYVNRAWHTVGLAIRNAVGLGLHIRSEASALSDLDKELRNRIWWSLFSLEHLVDEITGRPSCISYREISTPHPETFASDRQSGPRSSRPHPKRRKSGDVGGKGKAIDLKSQEMHANVARISLFTAFTPATYFSRRVSLVVLTHEILNRLFCAATVNNKWSEVQDITQEIDARLQRWKSSLPDELKFSDMGGEEDDEHVAQRKGLAVIYHTARMILHRPALCQMDDRIMNETTASHNFNQDAVVICVQSARALLATLGKPADPTRLYLIRPWWEVLHRLCQASGILMLEIAFGACHVGDHVYELLQDAKDAIHWLRAMSKQSIPARKAWEIHDRTFRLVSRKIDADISDMPTEAEVPPGWGPMPPEPRTSFNEQNISVFDDASIQSQRLAATTAWANSLLPSAGPASNNPETNQPFMMTEYPVVQPNFFQMPPFPQNSSDPYGNYDSSALPWYHDQWTVFDVQPQEMQGVTNTNIAEYQPYGSGMAASARMGMGNQASQNTGNLGQGQDESMADDMRQGYQNVEGPFQQQGPFGQQRHPGGGGC